MDVGAFFEVYRDWLRSVAPRLDGLLRGPVDERAVEEYEIAVGVEVPEELRGLWRVHDGESGPDNLGGTVGGMRLLGVTESRAEWEMWAKLRADSSDSDLRLLSSVAESVPPGAVQLEYTVPGWLPVLQESMSANYLGIDLAPGPQGAVGQIINFGRDEDRKRVVSNSLADLLGFIWSEVENGQIVVIPALPSGEQVLAHRRGELVSVLSAFAEAHGPLAAGVDPR